MVLGGRCVRTCVRSLRQTSVESIRSCQNLLHFARTCHNFVRTLLELTTTLPKLAVTCHKSIKLVKFSRIHLLSVSLKHFYCNWASPVTEPAQGRQACSYISAAECFLVVFNFVSIDSWVNKGVRKDKSASEAICYTNLQIIENFYRLLIIALINIDLINTYR